MEYSSSLQQPARLNLPCLLQGFPPTPGKPRSLCPGPSSGHRILFAPLSRFWPVNPAGAQSWPRAGNGLGVREGRSSRLGCSPPQSSQSRFDLGGLKTLSGGEKKAAVYFDAKPVLSRRHRLLRLRSEAGWERGKGSLSVYSCCLQRRVTVRENRAHRPAAPARALSQTFPGAAPGREEAPPRPGGGLLGTPDGTGRRLPGGAQLPPPLLSSGGQTAPPPPPKGSGTGTGRAAPLCSGVARKKTTKTPGFFFPGMCLGTDASRPCPPLPQARPPGGALAPRRRGGPGGADGGGAPWGEGPGGRPREVVAGGGAPRGVLWECGPGRWWPVAGFLRGGGPGRWQLVVGLLEGFPGGMAEKQFVTAAPPVIPGGLASHAPQGEGSAEITSPLTPLLCPASNPSVPCCRSLSLPPAPPFCTLLRGVVWVYVHFFCTDVLCAHAYTCEQPSCGSTRAWRRSPALLVLPKMYTLHLWTPQKAANTCSEAPKLKQAARSGDGLSSARWVLYCLKYYWMKSCEKGCCFPSSSWHRCNR